MHAETFVSGLGFGEEPRWHDGQLWFNDNWLCRLHAVRPCGSEARRIQLDFHPGGFGWLPDGRLLVADTRGCRLWTIASDSDVPQPYADVAAVAKLRLNGMCVATDGTAYVASIGNEPRPGAELKPGALIRVASDRTATLLTDDDVLFPNGVVLNPDESRLIVPESYSARCSVYDTADFTRRTILPFPGTYPDGSCAAADGTFWFADGGGRRCIHADLDGNVLREIALARHCYAPVLNAAGDTLYVAVADSHDPAVKKLETAEIVKVTL